jgi:hypothetical protein
MEHKQDNIAGKYLEYKFKARRCGHIDVFMKP